MGNEREENGKRKKKKVKHFLNSQCSFEIYPPSLFSDIGSGDKQGDPDFSKLEGPGFLLHGPGPTVCIRKYEIET